MKTKIILSGCGGKMGHAITALVAEREDCEICAGVDLVSTGHEGFPVFSSIFDYKGEADVLIDFSHPSVLDSLLAYGKERHLPLVLCTTGSAKSRRLPCARPARKFLSFRRAICPWGLTF